VGKTDRWRDFLLQAERGFNTLDLRRKGGGVEKKPGAKTKRLTVADENSGNVCAREWDVTTGYCSGTKRRRIVLPGGGKKPEEAEVGE